MKTLKIPVSNKAYELAQKARKGDLSQAVVQYLNSLPVSSNGLVSIDSLPALDGRRLTQKDWIAYFNEQKRQMISAPDVYRAVSAPKEVLDSLRKDFNDNWEVTSTRNSYNPNDLGAKITHNFGSTIVKPTVIELKVVPRYEGTRLTEALKSKETVAYLQALFNTKDSDKKIAETLEHLSQMNPEKIALWTPDQSSRKSYPERAVRFDHINGRFHVYGYDDFDFGNFGLSRGVRSSVSAEGAKRKK